MRVPLPKLTFWPGSSPMGSVTLVSIKEGKVGEPRDFSKERGRDTERQRQHLLERGKGGGRGKGTQRQESSRQKVRNAQQQPKTSMAMCSHPPGQELPLAFGFQDSSVSSRHTLNSAWEAQEKRSASRCLLVGTRPAVAAPSRTVPASLPVITAAWAREVQKLEIQA